MQQWYHNQQGKMEVHGEKPKYHFAYHKSHMDCPGIELRPLQ